MERMIASNLKSRMKGDVSLNKKRGKMTRKGAKSSQKKLKLTGTFLVDSSQPGIKEFLGLIRANLGESGKDSHVS